MDNRRMRLGVKKKALCERAGIKPEMYSYVLKRGETGQSLPAETMGKIYGALRALETETRREKKLKEK